MSTRRRLRGRLIDGAARAFSALLGRLPFSVAQAAGRGLGRLAWPLAGRDRRRTLEHLALAFPECTEAERRRLGRASFLHHGMNLAECLHLLARPREEAASHVAVEGWGRVDALRSAGRPILLLTAHLGNWELLGAVSSLRGLTLHAVVRPLDDPVLHRLLDRLRRHLGSVTIERGTRGAPRQLLQALKRGDALVMLIDQDTRVEGDWVPFFGRLAYTPTGAAKIALRQEAAVLPAFVERLADGSHRARFLEPLELPDDPVAATARMTELIEDEIRRCPEQWVWMHRRWRRRPPAESERI